MVIMKTRIKELREDTDRKQVEIARVLGMKQPQYSNVENEKFQLDYENLTKLAIFYNTSIDYLLRSNKSEIALSSCEYEHKKISVIIKRLFCAMILIRNQRNANFSFYI